MLVRNANQVKNVIKQACKTCGPQNLLVQSFKNFLIKYPISNRNINSK